VTEQRQFNALVGHMRKAHGYSLTFAPEFDEEHDLTWLQWMHSPYVISAQNPKGCQ
jgi:hypothetical protein